MKTILLILLLFPITLLAEPAKILRVVDGDTVVIAAPWVPDPLKKEISVRVLGVDTPEKTYRAQCDSEAQRGEAATEFTKHAVETSKTQEVIFHDWDKYGGRILGDIILDGQSLASMLVTNNLARDYHGEKKASWCN